MGAVWEVKEGPDQRADTTDLARLAMPAGPSGLSYGSRGCSHPCPHLHHHNTKSCYVTPRHGACVEKHSSFGVWFACLFIKYIKHRRHDLKLSLVKTPENFGFLSKQGCALNSEQQDYCWKSSPWLNTSHCQKASPIIQLKFAFS